jgi:hypothetical protein
MYKKLLLFLFSIGLVAAILYLAGFDETVEVMMSIPPTYILALLAIQIFMLFLSALKWRFILRHTKVSFKKLFASTLLGYLVNNLNPLGLVGGEPVKAYVLSKSGKVPTEKSFASVVVDLFLEIVPIFLLSALAISLILLYGIPFEIAAVLGFAALIILVFFMIAVGLVLNQGFSFRVINSAIGVISTVPVLKSKAAFLRREVDEIFSRFHEAMREHLLDNQTILVGTLISIIYWLARFLRIYLIFLAIGVKMPLSAIIIVQVVATVVSFFPILPGAIGIWEGTNIALYVLLGAPVGVTLAKATTVTIIDRILFYVIPSVLGVFAAFYLGINLSKLVKSEMKDEKVELEEISRIVSP